MSEWIDGGVEQSDYDLVEDIMEYCDTCNGDGFILTCCDDICNGLGFCIHGDGEEPCPVCGGYGEVAVIDDDYSDDFDDMGRYIGE